MVSKYNQRRRCSEGTDSADFTSDSDKDNSHANSKEKEVVEELLLEIESGDALKDLKP